MVALAGWMSVFGGREGRPRYRVGFALYGIALFTQGTIRGRREAGALGGEKHEALTLIVSSVVVAHRQLARLSTISSAESSARS
jgi:hypothetical protein